MADKRKRKPRERAAESARAEFGGHCAAVVRTFREAFPRYAVDYITEPDAVEIAAHVGIVVEDETEGAWGSIVGFPTLVPDADERGRACLYLPARLGMRPRVFAILRAAAKHVAPVDLPLWMIAEARATGDEGAVPAAITALLDSPEMSALILTGEVVAVSGMFARDWARRDGEAQLQEVRALMQSGPLWENPLADLLALSDDVLNELPPVEDAGSLPAALEALASRRRLPTEPSRHAYVRTTERAVMRSLWSGTRARISAERQAVGVTVPCWTCGDLYTRAMPRQRNCGRCIGKRKAKRAGLLPLTLLALGLGAPLAACGVPIEGAARQREPISAVQPAPVPRTYCHSGGCAKPGDTVPPPACPRGRWCASAY